MVLFKKAAKLPPLPQKQKTKLAVQNLADGKKKIITQPLPTQIGGKTNDNFKSLQNETTLDGALEAIHSIPLGMYNDNSNLDSFNKLQQMSKMNASRKEDLYTKITELNIREDQNALAYKLGVRFNSQEGGRRKGQTGYDYTNFALNLWDYESNVNRIVREKMT